MKTSSGGSNHHLAPRTDFQRALLFTLLSALVFGVLLIAQRPYWAGPWLISSLFTFGIWRLSRQPSK
jgi:hypothetical protein